MGEIFAEALSIVERCLLSIVAIFVAMIAIGIAAQGSGAGVAPRTVDLHIHHGDARVTSAP